MKFLSSDIAFTDFLARVSARPPRHERVVWTSEYLADHLYDKETERLLPHARQAVAGKRKRKYRFTPEQIAVAMRVIEREQSR